MGVQEEEVSEGVTFAFLALFLSCFFSCSSLSDSSTFSLSTSSTTSLQFFPLLEVVLEDEVVMEAESGLGHLQDM